MVSWIKKLFHIVKHFDNYTHEIDKALIKLAQQQRDTQYHVDDAVRIIKDRTTLHTDIHPPLAGRRSQIILIGRYHNTDYIEVFDVAPDDFNSLMQQCGAMQKYACTGQVDAPPELKQIFKNNWRTY